MTTTENMNRLTIFTYSLIVLGFIVADIPVNGEPQRDSSRFPPPQGQPPGTPPFNQAWLTTTTTTPAPVLAPNFPLGPALQLAQQIVGSVLNANRPTDPPPPITPRHFSCRGRAPGYYADVSTGCKNFYICTPQGRRYYQHCGERTIFNQLLLICDFRRNYDCQLAPQHYSINEVRRPFQD